MTPNAPSARRILRGAAYGIAVLAPLLLLVDLQTTFARDWPNHFWMIGYYGEYFRQHGDFPTVMNIGPAVGIAIPVFYTWLLYPLLGLMAAAVGPALALRLGLLAMVALQFGSLISAGQKVFRQSVVTYTVAASVIWASYSLSNLYNRGAIAEFFATGFLVTAIGFGTSAALTTSSASRWFNSWLAGLCLLLAIGTHLPTAVVAMGFFAVLAAGLALGWRKAGRSLPAGLGWRVAAGILAGGLILSPWVYATVKLGHQLAVASGITRFIFRPDNSDSIWARFAPFPYDLATMEHGIYDVFGTPYLATPLNFVLLGILLWNLELYRRRTRTPPGAGASDGFLARVVLVVAGAWFLFLTTLSVSPWLAGHLEFFAPYIQYVYRLVSHCNAALLVAVFASGLLVNRQAGYQRFRHQTHLVLAVGLTVAILGLGIKLQQGAVVEVPEGGQPQGMMSARVELAEAYSTPGLVTELDGAALQEMVAVSFPVGWKKEHFGEIGAANVEMKKAGWVRTNAVVFPWMKLLVDGRPLDDSQLARVRYRQAVYLEAGAHEIRPVWRPDPLWSLLYRVSQVTFALVLLGTGIWAVIRWKDRESAPA